MLETVGEEVRKPNLTPKLSSSLTGQRLHGEAHRLEGPLNHDEWFLGGSRRGPGFWKQGLPAGPPAQPKPDVTVTAEQVQPGRTPAGQKEGREDEASCSDTASML